MQQGDIEKATKHWNETAALGDAFAMRKNGRAHAPVHSFVVPQVELANNMSEFNVRVVKEETM